MKNNQKFFGVIDIYPNFSAYFISNKIKVFFLAIFALVAGLYFYNKYVALYVIYYAAFAIALTSVLVKLFFFTVGIAANLMQQKTLPLPRDDELPLYTIMLPVHKEATILPQLISNIDGIDYPKNKLEVLLLIEEDDQETISCVNSQSLPKYFKKIIIPTSFPQTKPKACNYGLAHATGEFITIYDAEDVPDPLQLKKAVAKFRSLPTKYICLQACLLPYNHNTGIIAGCAALEYSMWFEFMLKALDLLGFPLLLGGSSNHFKRKKLDEIGRWDDFNVTEDADLGIRISKFGYKSTILDSITHEEAPINFLQFIKQRSRWIKGYFKTYLVHQNSKPRKTKFVCNYFLGLSIFSFIARLILLAGFLLVKDNYLAMILLCKECGLNLIILTSVCLKRKWKNLWPSILLFHHYFILHSIAALVACYELICKPFYWSKTEHGLQKFSVNIENEVEISKQDESYRR